jgi:ABC-type bacteriocin/lantibiotic exporter with double-glycine peptidase domain
MFLCLTGRVLLGIGLFLSLVCADGRSLWIDVPFVKQEKHGCGAASIAMLMRYWSRDVDPHQIQQTLYSGEAKGIRGTDAEAYLREHGFRTFVFRGEWRDLERHLAKGRPLMVCLNEGHDGTQQHYVVVAGVDTARNLVLINDPARRKLLKAERAAFEKSWSEAERWTLLAIPQER